MNNTSKKYYIGLSVGSHDPAITLVDDTGNIVFAEATERYLQNKMGLNTAADNVFFVDKIFKKYPIQDYEVAINWHIYENIIKYALFSVLIYVLRKYTLIVNWLGIFKKYDRNEYASTYNYLLSTHFSTVSMATSGLRFILNNHFKLPYKTIHSFDHHLCHTYYAYFTSPCTNATIVVIDGDGDESSSLSVYKASNQSVSKVYRNKFRASLGRYYSIMTYMCGFSLIAGEEWKVMGMAPYGKKNNELLNDLKEWIYTSGIQLKFKNKIQFLKIRDKIKNNIYSELKIVDIAFTAQLYYESLVTELINEIHLKWPSENLILVGGCALNSVFNGKIHTTTPFKNVYIPSAPGDDGCSIGAALLNFKKHNPSKLIPYGQINPYLGFKIQDSEI